MRKLARTPRGVQAVVFSRFPRSTNPDLCTAYRSLDDIDQSHADLVVTHLGGNVHRVIESGSCGIVTTEFLRLMEPAPSFVKRGAIVLACRNAVGEVVALHDHRLEWLTAATVHISNPIRARWAEIQICGTTSEADSVALEENVCAIGRNGCDKKTVAAAVLAARRGTTEHEIRRAEKSHPWAVAA